MLRMWIRGLVFVLVGVGIAIPAGATVTTLCPIKGASTDTVKVNIGRASYWFGNDPLAELTGSAPITEAVDFLAFDPNAINTALAAGISTVSLRIYFSSCLKKWEWLWDTRSAIKMGLLTQSWSGSDGYHCTTWQCPEDTECRNDTQDCATSWGGGPYVASETADWKPGNDSFSCSPDESGWTESIDVTEDVKRWSNCPTCDNDLANYGWRMWRTGTAGNVTVALATYNPSTCLPSLVLDDGVLTPTPTETPTETETPTPSHTRTQTITLTPALTATPTSTSTITPTVTLTPTRTPTNTRVITRTPVVVSTVVIRQRYGCDGM